MLKKISKASLIFTLNLSIVLANFQRIQADIDSILAFELIKTGHDFDSEMANFNNFGNFTGRSLLTTLDNNDDNTEPIQGQDRNNMIRTIYHSDMKELDR